MDDDGMMLRAKTIMTILVASVIITIVYHHIIISIGTFGRFCKIC